MELCYNGVMGVDANNKSPDTVGYQQKSSTMKLQYEFPLFDCCSMSGVVKTSPNILAVALGCSPGLDGEILLLKVTHT